MSECILRKNVNYCRHVRKKETFSTMTKQEEKNVNSLFCIAFNALSK